MALKFYMALLSAVCILTGCAGRSLFAPAESPSVALSSKDALFLPLPQLPDSLDPALSSIGWGGGRFGQELRKEIVYQFNRKGVAVVEDSAAAAAWLHIRVSEYAQSKKSAARFIGFALLKTAQGERSIAFGKAKAGGAEVPEREEPTVDRIREIAEAVVAGSREDPSAKKRKGKEYEYQPQMWMIF